MNLLTLIVGAICLGVYCHKEQTTPYQVYLRAKLHIKLLLIKYHLMSD